MDRNEKLTCDFTYEIISFDYYSSYSEGAPISVRDAIFRSDRILLGKIEFEGPSDHITLDCDSKKHRSKGITSGQ